MNNIKLFIISMVLAFTAGITFLAAQPTYVSAKLEPTQQVAQRIFAEPANVQPAAPEVKPAEAPSGAVFFSDVRADWIVCVNEGARVYSNPGTDAAWYLKTLEDGTPVTVRELDSTRAFAMIEPAQYVNFTDLCEP